MEKEQELEWAEAQKIAFTCEDLIAVARRQLLFLRAVDRHRDLYADGPVLRRAIYRYKNCWLPLLDKYDGPKTVNDGLLVVPLDCEWIWHCHRLNPLQYRKDCENLYGRILDSQYVESTTTAKSAHSVAELWVRLYPEESFELDYGNKSFDVIPAVTKNFDYDLVAAVIRQTSFYYQVSRPVMHDNRFLEGAVSRYKGFLHLIKRNQENSLKRFCVPTYDVDIIWHSHQLQPLAYCNDMTKLLGEVLGHDDTTSDRSKGSKLNTGFSETTKQWEEIYGLRYWRGGAMHRGSVPSPVTRTPLYSGTNTSIVSPDYCHKYINISSTKVVEVLLEVVSVKNAPPHQKGSLFIYFGKKGPDMFLGCGRYRLNIQSETGTQQRASFECEPSGDLTINLMLKSTMSWSAKTVGTTSISVQDLMNCDSELAMEKWFELNLKSGYLGSKPICLHIAASFTVPVAAPHALKMVRSLPFTINTCFFPFQEKVRTTHAWSHFGDDNNEFISLRMRKLKKNGDDNKLISKQVVFLGRGSGVTHVLAELTGKVWSLVDSKFVLSMENEISQDGQLFDFIGEPMMKIYRGKRLHFAPKNCNCKKHENDRHYITVVGFFADDPYGRAIALINLKSVFLKVTEDWFVLPGILLTFILSDMLKSQGYNAFDPRSENPRESTGLDQEAPLQKMTGPMQINRATMEKDCANNQSSKCEDGCSDGSKEMQGSGNE